MPRFIAGSLSCMIPVPCNPNVTFLLSNPLLVMNPIEVVKTRLQLQVTLNLLLFSQLYGGRTVFSISKEVPRIATWNVHHFHRRVHTWSIQRVISFNTHRFKHLLLLVVLLCLNSSNPCLILLRFTPSVIREGLYAGLRMGLYEPLKLLMGEDPTKGGLSFWKKLICGSLAGALGAAIATPSLYSLSFSHTTQFATSC